MTAATGFLARPLHRVRDGLLVGPTWQDWCGSAEQAATDTYLVAAPVGLKRLHAIIDLAGDTGRDRSDIDGGFTTRGGVLLYFCAPVEVGTGHQEAMTRFLEQVAAVMVDLEQTTSEGGNRPVIDGYDLDKGPARTPSEQRDKGFDDLEVQFLVRLTEWPS